VETDTYAAFHAALDKAAANPEIKNFVIDLSAKGGGSCSVQYCSTADGWLYTISNNIHLINKAGEDIDCGVPVKEILVNEDENGSRDYSGFYDPEHIREYIIAAIDTR